MTEKIKTINIYNPDEHLDINKLLSIIAKFHDIKINKKDINLTIPKSMILVPLYSWSRTAYEIGRILARTDDKILVFFPKITSTNHGYTRRNRIVILSGVGVDVKNVKGKYFVSDKSYFGSYSRDDWNIFLLSDFNSSEILEIRDKIGNEYPDVKVIDRCLFDNLKKKIMQKELEEKKKEEEKRKTEKKIETIERKKEKRLDDIYRIKCKAVESIPDGSYVFNIEVDKTRISVSKSKRVDLLSNLKYPITIVEFSIAPISVNNYIIDRQKLIRMQHYNKISSISSNIITMAFTYYLENWKKFSDIQINYHYFEMFGQSPLKTTREQKVTLIIKQQPKNVTINNITTTLTKGKELMNYVYKTLRNHSNNQTSNVNIDKEIGQLIQKIDKYSLKQIQVLFKKTHKFKNTVPQIPFNVGITMRDKWYIVFKKRHYLKWSSSNKKDLEHLLMYAKSERHPYIINNIPLLIYTVDQIIPGIQNELIQYTKMIKTASAI